MCWRKERYTDQRKPGHTTFTGVCRYYNERFLKVEEDLIFPVWQHHHHFLSPYVYPCSYLCLKFSSPFDRPVAVCSFYRTHINCYFLCEALPKLSRKWLSLPSGISNRLRTVWHRLFRHHGDHFTPWSQRIFFNHLCCISTYNSGSHGSCSIYIYWINTKGIH